MVDQVPPEVPQAPGPAPEQADLGQRLGNLERTVGKLAAAVGGLAQRVEGLVQRPAAPARAEVPPEPRVGPAPGEIEEAGLERRVELAAYMDHELDRMSTDFTQEYTKGLFGRREQRNIGFFRKLLMRIPYAGALFSGKFAIADLDKYLPPRMMVEHGVSAALPASTLAEVGGKINTARDLLLATRGAVEAIAAPTAIAALAGAGLRVTTDTLRWIGGEKTVRTLARQIAWQATGRGRSLDTRAAWYILFGRRMKDLEELVRRGPTLVPEEAERFIREAFYAETNLRALDGLLPPDQQQKFAETQLRDMQTVRQAYEQARTLYDGLPAEIKDRIIDGFPDWVRRREFFNHLETMGLRGVIAGFKTACFGAAFSLARGLFSTGIMGEVGRRISERVGPAASEMAKIGQDAWNNLVNSADKFLGKWRL